MKYCESGVGRVFILRLEDRDSLPRTIENFAAEKGLLRAACYVLGGAAGGSRLVVGPEDGDEKPPRPMTLPLEGVHEMAGFGTIFPDEEGRPSLHLHAACGRGSETKTGCVRPGVDVWKVGEVILFELTDCSAQRRRDPETGFSLLEP
jgi:predicted DNA-binding protein with PD1-like motif